MYLKALMENIVFVLSFVKKYQELSSLTLKACAW